MAIGIRHGIFAIAFVLSVAGGSDQICGYDVANDATLRVSLSGHIPYDEEMREHTTARPET